MHGKTWRHLYQLLLAGDFDQAFESELHTEEQVAPRSGEPARWCRTSA